MPIKIITGATNPDEGLINKSEMDDVIQNYVDDIEVSSISGDLEPIKNYWCWYTKNEMLRLLGIDPDELTENCFIDPSIDGVRIHSGVHMEGLLSCEGEDYSNFINTVLFATIPHTVGEETVHVDLRDYDNEVLIPGFKAHTLGAMQGDCCGGMSGGGTPPPTPPPSPIE